MYTTNCQVCGTKSSRNSRRCRKHERRSTYSAARDFPVYFLKTKWYVNHELPGMWYEIKHKQQKMPKARANINVYSSTLFSGLIFEDEMILYHVLQGMWYDLKHKQQKMPKARANIYVYSSTLFSGLIFEDEKTVPYDDDTRNCMVRDTKSDRPPCFVLRKGPSMPRRNWSIRREEPSIAITADLRPFVTHTGLALSTALLTRHPWRILASISMQNVNWRTRRAPFLHHF